MKSSRRVVVTGLGLVTPVGNSTQESWNNIIHGKSGVDFIKDFNPIPSPEIQDFKVRFAGQVKNFDPADHMSVKDVKKFDPFTWYGIAAANEAIKDSGLNLTKIDSFRAGVSIGAGIGGITTLEMTRTSITERGLKRISPFCIPATIINMLSGQVSIMHGLRGPNIPIVTACTTGTHNIGMSARLIAYGDADIMITGGAEKASTPIGMSGFAAARALSTNNSNPQAASRPWDKDRDGFVLGDGSGVLVLEEYDHAIRRGANIYAEIAGFGMSADAYHMTLPSKEGQKKAIQNAIQDANIDNPGVINYVNAHGTSTPAGDVQESQCVEDIIYPNNPGIVMSSTKSMTGHLLGAAGAIESIFSILAIKDQIAPPTINLDNIDNDCNLDYAANKAKPMEINYVLKNSFGFGGTNGALIFKKHTI